MLRQTTVLSSCAAHDRTQTFLHDSTQLAVGKASEGMTAVSANPK